MIRKAPVAFIATAAVMAVGFHWFENKQHTDEVGGLRTIIGTHEATIKNQETTIAQLQEQLKGISPQLAAIQAGRDKIRRQLQQFYITSGELLYRQPKTDDDVDQLERDADQWANQCVTWIASNMGDAARERFLEPSQMAGLIWSGAVNQKQNNVRNYIINARKNLSTLIETAAWDGTSASKD
jgi:hypothetical protein